MTLSPSWASLLTSTFVHWNVLLGWAAAQRPMTITWLVSPSWASVLTATLHLHTPQRSQMNVQTGLIIMALPPLPPHVCCLFSILSVDHHSPISSATQAKTREPSSSTSSLPSKSTCRWSPSLISSPLQSQICSFFPILTTEFRSSSSLLQLCHLL